MAHGHDHTDSECGKCICKIFFLSAKNVSVDEVEVVQETAVGGGRELLVTGVKGHRNNFLQPLTCTAGEYVHKHSSPLIITDLLQVSLTSLGQDVNWLSTDLSHFSYFFLSPEDSKNWRVTALEQNITQRRVQVWLGVVPWITVFQLVVA